MDFRSLSRRELQALCKRNKIPANLTNVAMVDSLKALDTVEGIDEILQACKSEIAQSSIEPPSPYVTPAPLGGASRRRRAAKGGSAVTQVGGTRRSARLAEKSARLSKGVGNGNTGLSNKDLFIADGQEVKINLEESLDSLDEMSGVTDMEENCERNHEGQVDSADKQDVFTVVKPVQTVEVVTENSVELLEQVGDEISDLLKKDLSSDDGPLVFKESPDGLDNITGVNDLDKTSEKLSSDDGLVVLKESPDGLDNITGVIGLDKTYEENGEAQIDSSEKQGMSIDEIIQDQMNNISENDGATSKLKDDFSTETKGQGDVSQDFGFADAMNTVMEVNSMEKDEAEVENSVEKEEGEIVEKESISDAVDVKTVLNETMDEEIDQEGFGSEINIESGDEDEFVTDDKVFSDEEITSNDEDSDPDENEELDTDSSETESDFDESDSITLDLTQESTPTKNKDSSDCMASEISSMSYEDLAIDEETESDVTTTNQVSYTGELLSEETTDELKRLQVAAPAPKTITTPIVVKEAPLIFTGSDVSSFVTQPIISTPKGASANKVYSRRIRMAAGTDNKENVGSGSKTAPAKMRSKIMKEIADTASKLDDHNLKKLAEDMKELHIQNLEGADEVGARIALQVLPENREAERLSASTVERL